MANPGLLQPLEIPTQSWTDISLDFIEGLPKSQRKDVILVVDRFTKYAHFLALQHPNTAAQVAELFIKEIYKLHGLPNTMVLDREKVFTSVFWQHLFKAAGTTLCMSTAYHLESDGKTERLNMCLEVYPRAMTMSKPKMWANWLHLAEWWYNTNYHTSLQSTPFQAFYDYDPPNGATTADSSASCPGFDSGEDSILVGS